MLTKLLINYITLISSLFWETGTHICRFAFAANVIPSPSNTANCVITFWWFKLDSCRFPSDFQFFHRPATWTPCVFQIVSKTILSCIIGKSTDKNDTRLEEKSLTHINLLVEIENWEQASFPQSSLSRPRKKV